MATTHDDEQQPIENIRYPQSAGFLQSNRQRELLEAAAAQSRDFVVTRTSAEAVRALFRATASACASDVAAKSDAFALSIISDACTAPHEASTHGVLVSIEVQQQRLAATRFQHQQLLSPPSIVVSRTLAAVSSHVLVAGQPEGCDQPFVLGATELTLPAFADCQHAYARRLGLHERPACAKASSWLNAQQADDAHSFVATWQHAAGLRTFGEAVAEVMNWPIMDSAELPMPPAVWREYSRSRPLPELREHADVLGILPTWDSEHARTLEGYYHARGGIDYALARSLATAACADMLWLVSATPDLNDARRFAQGLHGQLPGKPLVYQLTAGGEAALIAQGSGAWQRFGEELQQLGFVLHVSTHGGVGARVLRDPVRLVP